MLCPNCLNILGDQAASLLSFFSLQAVLITKCSSYSLWEDGKDISEGFFLWKMGSISEEKKVNISASVTQQLSTNFQI